MEIDILKPCAGEDYYNARTIMAVESWPGKSGQGDK